MKTYVNSHGDEDMTRTMRHRVEDEMLLKDVLEQVKAFLAMIKSLMRTITAFI